MNIKRNTSVDYAKYIAAILVVAIHTAPLTEISAEVNFFLTNILCRIAVPFFAVCTGYYLTNAIITQKHLKPIIRIIKKIVYMYVKWSLLYLVIHLINWSKNEDIDTIIHYTIGWCKSFFYSASYYHLWYLISLIYALIAFYIIIKYIHTKYFPHIVIVLWILEVLEYGYYSFLPINIQYYFNLLYKSGNLLTALTRILPLLMVGTLIAKSNFHKYYRIGTIVSFICLIIEVYFIRNIGGKRFSFIIFTLPLAYFLFINILHIHSYTKNNNSKKFADLSMLIYCLHPAIIWILKEICIIPPFIIFIVTCIICTIIGYLFYSKSSKRRVC